MSRNFFTTLLLLVVSIWSAFSAHKSSHPLFYKLPVQEENVLVNGLVIDKKTNRPTAAKISIKDISSHEVLSQYYSDSKSGKYVFVLNEGLYQIMIEAKGFQLYYEDLDLRNIVGGELKKNFNILPIGFKDVDIPKTNTPPADNAAKKEDAANNPDFVNTAPKEQAKSIQPVSNPQVTEMQVLTRDGESYIKSDIDFDAGQYTLNPEAIGELNRVVVFLRNNSNMKIEIGSHTGLGGDTKKNMELTEMRANEIADYINYQGIAKDRLQSKGYGSTTPLVSSTTAEASSKNERVELKVLKEQPAAASAQQASPEAKQENKTEPKEESIQEKPASKGTSMNKDVERLRDKDVELIQGMKIFFEGKKAKVLSSSYKTLDSVLNYMVKFPSISIEMTGYSDLITNKAKSKKASEKRAMAVVNYLAGKGVDKKRMTWVGAGSTKFIALNKTNQGRAKNRRVEFRVTGFQSGIELSAEEVKKEVLPPTPPVEVKTEPAPPPPPPTPTPTPTPTPAPTTAKTMDELYYEMLRDFGDFTKENLVFKVQVGAFLNPLVPASPIYKVAPDAKGEKGADGLTRYYSGKFDKLNDAEAVRQQYLAKGLTGTWVVAFYNGEKMTRPQMLQLFGTIPPGVR